MSNLTLDYKNRMSRYFFEETSGVSREVDLERTTQDEIFLHYFSPVSRKTPFIEFFDLAQQWKEETKYFSSVTDICMHPAYQQIIGMGSKALTYIFVELELELNHWFWALSMITGIDPIPHDCDVKMEKMKAIWLDWAKKNDYL